MSQMHPPYYINQDGTGLHLTPPVVPGTKYDAGKHRPTLLVMSLADALTRVSEVLTYGANKYDDDNWRHVPNGVTRYTDALLRHLLAEGTGEQYDQESGLMHAAHTATNALLRLELMLREARDADSDIPF